MELVLYILAFAGVSAILLRLGRALFILVFRSGEAWLAKELADRRQEHGDLTGLSEAAERERVARRLKRASAIMVVVWLVLLLVPPFTPWTLEIYAASALLWFTSTRLFIGSTSSAVEVRR